MSFRHGVVFVGVFQLKPVRGSQGAYAMEAVPRDAVHQPIMRRQPLFVWGSSWVSPQIVSMTKYRIALSIKFLDPVSFSSEAS